MSITIELIGDQIYAQYGDKVVMFDYEGDFLESAKIAFRKLTEPEKTSQELAKELGDAMFEAEFNRFF